MNPSTITPNSTGRAFWSASYLSTLVCGSLAFLAGCSSEPVSHVVSAPPPAAPSTQVVVAQPAAPVQAVPTANGGTIIVQQAPPVTQQEYVSAQPTSDHKWIPGYWTWSTSNSRYEWVGGHWEIPPTRGAVWITPRWERTDSGAYRFYEGYWN